MASADLNQASPILSYSQGVYLSTWNNAARSEIADMSVQLSQARGIWRGYLLGQLANVSKAALWWSTFGILAVAMLESDLALAVTRAPFNLALLITSPMAVAAAEKFRIRRLLLVTTTGRLIVWSFLIPITWIIVRNALGDLSIFWGLIIFLMFCDGVQVAFSNAVDIDCGGLDSLSNAYDLPLTDFLRYRFTTIHQLVFDSSFIFLTPPIIMLFVFISRHFQTPIAAAATQLLTPQQQQQPPASLLPSHTPTDSHNWLHALARLIPTQITGQDPSVFVLSLGIAIVFGILSSLSLYFYSKYIPPPPPRNPPHAASLIAAEGGGTTTTAAHTRSTRNEEIGWPYEPVAAPASLRRAYKEKLSEVVDGFLFVYRDRALKWRLVLLALETALEDSMVSVIIPMIALHAISFLGHTTDRTVAALISAVAIAVGKLGGVLAGVYLATNYTNNDQAQRPPRHLFTHVLLSSLSLILLPWGYITAERALMPMKPNTAFIPSPSPLFSCAAVLVGVFLFFVFSTAPKIGFASLIQNRVTQDDQAARVFGFTGMFVTITDGIMITIINLIFYFPGRERFDLALWLVFAFYMVHAIAEWTLGPRLVRQQPTIDRTSSAASPHNGTYCSGP